jgi:uncharacterized protein (DUF111 family)
MELEKAIRRSLTFSGYGGESYKQRSNNSIYGKTNIDDMNPEFFELVEERLFSAGALDIFKTPYLIKKKADLQFN